MDSDKDNQKTENDKITKQNLAVGTKVLFKYLSEYKKQIVLISWMGILAALCDGFAPYISGAFFDAIIKVATTTSLFGLPLYVDLLALWTLIQLVSSLLNWRITVLSEYLSNAIWLDYLSKGFGYLLNLPISFHKTYKIGEIGDKINNAAGSLETIAGRIVIDLSPQVLSIVIAFAVAFFLNWTLALLLFLGVAIYVFVLVKNVAPLSGYQKEYRSVLWSSFGDAYDVVNNTLAIKQATAEQYEQTRLAKKMKSAVPLWMRLTNAWGRLTLYQQVTILLTRTAIFALSIYFIFHGRITIGELLAFNAYAALVFGPFITIARNWQTIQNGLVNIEETEKILTLAPEPYDPPGAIAEPLRGDIEFKNVSFKYEEGKPVLIDVSFKVKAGQVVALVGESGVGKSTLIDLISGYHHPNEGEVKIDSHPIQKMNLRSLRSQMAIVPQEVVLFNDTILTNVRYGNFKSTEEEVKSAAIKASALDFIEKFPEKWQQLVGERGIKLSVGQKQRVAIARAILRDPRILVLDEPTSALDAGTEKIITDSLNTLMKDRTTFIIAHRLSTVRKADMILVFKDGKIIESGKHEELLQIAGGEYRRLYDLQIGLHG